MRALFILISEEGNGETRVWASHFEKVTNYSMNSLVVVYYQGESTLVVTTKYS